MNLLELVKKVARVTGQDVEECGATVDVLFSEMASRLRAGEEVKIPGLGTFHWQYRKQSRRKLRGVYVAVPEAFVLKFRPSDSLKKMEIRDGETRSRGGPSKSQGGREEGKGEDGESNGDERSMGS